MRVLEQTQCTYAMLASSLRTTLTASVSLCLTPVSAVLMATKRKYYAVVAGKNPGIYESWNECELQVKNFKGAKYKSFPSKEEAETYIETEKRVTKVARVSTTGRTQLQQSTLSSSMSTQLKRARKTPMKNPALQMSSSLLELFPEDIEEHVVLTREPSLDQTTEATPSKSPMQLPAGLESVSDVNVMYQLEYDGASKGNPGAAGAGALLRHPDGTVVCEVSVGLGKATNNVAEYRGLIAGMRRALDLGIQRIQAQGDSKLVKMQLNGEWKINNKYLDALCEEAKELKKKFKDFEISHVAREYNSAADILANKGVGLPEEKFLSPFSAVNEKIKAARDAVV